MTTTTTPLPAKLTVVHMNLEEAQVQYLREFAVPRNRFYIVTRNAVGANGRTKVRTVQCTALTEAGARKTLDGWAGARYAPRLYLLNPDTFTFTKIV